MSAFGYQKLKKWGNSKEKQLDNLDDADDAAKAVAQAAEARGKAEKEDDILEYVCWKHGVTGTIWDKITSTADNIPNTEIPATFKIILNKNINYVNPETGTNTLWTNSNATEHMGEYIKRFGEESWSIKTRSQAMLESYSASLNKAMEELIKKTPGRYFGTYSNWEIGINTETGVVFHALMLN